MGQNQSVGYQEIDVNIGHPKFKKAKIYTNNSTSKLVSQLSIQQPKYKNWQKVLSSHKSLNKQFLLIPESFQYNHQRFCSTHGTIKIIYENFPYLLKNQINDRIGRKQYFSEQQIWYLMFAIFSAKKSLNDQKINCGNLGNINPQNIFLSQNTQIKIGNILSWPGDQELQDNKRIISQNYKRYLAPQDFIQLSLGISYCNVTNQSQLFAIGLTLLGIGILKDNNQIYNFQTKKINLNQLLVRINLWKSTNRYSDLLKAVVELLCVFQPKQRLKSSQINQIFVRGQNSIRNKKKFTIYPVAAKIQDKIRSYKKGKQTPNVPNVLPKNFNEIIPLNIISKTVNQNKIDKNPPNNLSEKIFNQIVKQQQSILNGSISSPRNLSIKMVNGIQNSLNLTQVILAPPNKYGSNEVISENSNNQSLFSSIDHGIKFKKTISDPRQSNQAQHSLQRYQQINKNNNLARNQTTLSQTDFLDLVNLTKQIIVQKPVVIDAKRRSDDIMEQMTPVQTPNGTPLNRSYAKEEQKSGFGRNFYTPSNMLEQRQSSKHLSKTTTLIINNSLKPQSIDRISGNNSADSPNKLRVKQTKSHDPDINLNSRQQLAKTVNSTITMYIPLVDGQSVYQSSKTSSWQTSKHKMPSQQSSRKYVIKLPQACILQRSKQCSQIQISQLTPEDKHKIQEQMIQKIQNLISKVPKQTNQTKRIVTFADSHQILDMSHESKVLEIDDIDLECLQQQNDQTCQKSTDRILVEYRQPNESHIVIQSVKVSKNNSNAAI